MKNTNTIPVLILVLSVIVLFAGCASEGEFKHNAANVDVKLESNNYQMVKAGATGHSTGFYLLGFIPFCSPTYSEAKADLYNSINEPLKGRAIALANQTEDRGGLYVILFSLPKVTITADVLEFTGPTNSIQK